MKIKVNPQPIWVSASCRWCYEYKLHDKKMYSTTATCEWWEYVPSEVKPHPEAKAILESDGWYWVYDEDVICPFCDKKDFDLVGLKDHYNETKLWENNRFYVTYFENGKRWYLYVKKENDKYQLAMCVSNKIWKHEYKNSPEIFCNKIINKRIKAINDHIAKLKSQILSLESELILIRCDDL
jgi:hypothetical protein